MRCPGPFRLRRILPALVLAAGVAAPLAAQEPSLPLPTREREERREEKKASPPEVRAPLGTPTEGARGSAPADTAGEQAAAQEADPVFQELLRLEGYTPVEYRGKTAEFRAEEGMLRLWGEAEVSREGEKLTADSIVYQERTKLTSAYGNPKVSGKTQDIQGDVLLYDMERKLARVKGGRTQYAQGTTWYVRGEEVLAEQQTDRLYAQNTTFTSDEREEPQYHFKAGKTLIVKDRLLVGRPATLYFRNVPVAWFPFFVQDMEKGRRSGILTPRFGINDIVRTSSGYQRQISNVGYYWAINEYMGAQVSGEWRSNSYTSLLGSLDFNWRRQFLNGSVSWREYFPENSAHQRTTSGNLSWKPDERTDLSFQGSYASSSEFVRDRSTDPLEATQELQSNLNLSRRFDWGQVSLGARRRQALGDGRVETTLPSFGINPNTVTLFRSASPEQARWYNDVSLSFGGSGSWSSVDVPVDTLTTPDGVFRVGQRSQDGANLQMSQSLSMGNLSLSNTASLNRESLRAIPGVDSVASFANDRGQWASSLSYRIGLIGSTSISPTLSLSQDFRRADGVRRGDFVSAPLPGGYVAGAMRTSLGASLNTDLYGFFPGVGPLQTVRHHLKPSLSYGYSPQVAQNRLQERVFGPEGGLTQNRVTLSLDQTFEGKIRSSTPRPADTAAAGDTTSAGAAAVGGGAAPAEARKVTLLAINTSAVAYDFARPDSLGSGFETDQVSNTIRSDYLQGLNFSFTHDLFEDAPGGRFNQRGKFAPQLSSLNASFSFGQESAFFRWLRERFGGGAESMVPAHGMVPDSSPPQPAAPVGAPTATANPQDAGGGGPWSVSLSYALVRQRDFHGGFQGGFGVPRGKLDRSFQGGPGFGRGADESLTNQTVNATLNFAPTRNWQVNWVTSYDITRGEFGAHSLRLVRDLHRWQANFSFYRTPVGNTSFEFAVHLKDLPDLKLDYRERDIGVDRRGSF